MAPRKTRLAKHLKDGRKQARLTQAEVGKRVGVSASTIHNWEIGTGKPNTAQAKELDLFLVYSDDDKKLRGPEIEPYGAWLARERNQRKMTVQKLAEKAGVSVPVIHNIEAGRSIHPQAATRNALETALGAAVPAKVAAATKKSATIVGLGFLVDFEPHDESNWPNEPGVYVFYDIAERPLYVGKSQNIKRRMRGHKDKFWFRPPIVARGSYISIADEGLRGQVEQILIKFLKSNAVLNRQLVDRGSDD